MKTKKIDSEAASKSEKAKRPSKRYAVMKDFSRFLAAAIDRAGYENPTAFARANKIVDQTLFNYLRQLRLPDLPQLIKLGRVLNQALPGENITSQTLFALLSPEDGDSMTAEEAARSFEPLPWPKEIVDWYQELPFAERRAIAPILAQQIAEDLELCSECGLTVLAILVQREMDALKVGPETFAKRYGVPLDVLHQILQAKDPFEAPESIEGLTLTHLRNLADNTRDPDRNLGNMPLFLELSGWPVDIRDFLSAFMAQHNLMTFEALVDFCLESSGLTAADVDRPALIRSVQTMVIQNEIPSNLDPAYATIVAEIGGLMGFSNVEEFLTAVRRAKKLPL